MSRVCEEFHCLPSRAMWELENDPDQWALQIIPLRAYAGAKSEYDGIASAEQMAQAIKRNKLLLTVHANAETLALEQVARDAEQERG